jgi:uncharacterized protein (TIGR02246 family)
MRRLITMILMASSSVALGGGPTGSAEDAAILKVHQDFAASWNKHDYKAMAAIFADDADLINPIGRVAKGKAEIEKLYMDEQTTGFRGSRFTSDCKAGVRVVKPDVAVVTCAFEVTDAKLPDGNRMPPLKGLYTATMIKVNTKWRVVAGRPMIPFAPPPPPASK